MEVIGTRDRDSRPLRTTICRHCGLVWSNPRPQQEDVRRYYSREYRLHYKGHSTPSLRHVARSGRGALNRYGVLRPYLSKGHRILDAGAGSGEVVYVLRRFGLDAVGLEPDEEYARHARESLGVPVVTGFVQDAAFPLHSFNVVTMYHALEHVENPLAVLCRLRCWVADDGVLVVEVPNVEATCISPDRRYHFAHFYNFSDATLEALGRRAGFEPTRTTTSPDGGNLISVFKAVKGAPVEQSDCSAYARVVEVVRNHTSAKYYASRYPYIGPLNRLRTSIVDRMATFGCTAPRQVLDKLIAGAAGMESAA